MNMAKSIQNFKFLHKREDILPYTTRMWQEGDQEKKSLGFWPPAAYTTAAHSEKIIIAVSKDTNEYAGHIFYGGVFPHARVFQVLVNKKFRKNGLASDLIERLISSLEKHSFSSISAKVATDLLGANHLYDRNGFKIIKTIDGGKTTGRKLHLRGRELNTPSLFSWVPHPEVSNHLSLPLHSPTKSPQYLIDLNVIFDAVRKRSNTEAAGTLFKAGFQNLIRIAASEELISELERNSKDKNNDPVLELAKNFWRLAKPSPQKIKEYSDILAPIIFPDRYRDNILTVQDKSDLVHLATAIENGVAGFITSEKNILAANDYLRAEYQIDVISLFDLQELVEDDHEQQPSLADQKTTIDLHTNLINSFENSQEASDAIKALNIPQESLPNSELSRSKDLRSLVISTRDGQPIAFAWWSALNGPTPINTAYICIDETADNVETSIDYICDRISRECSKRDVSLVKLKSNINSSLANTTLERNGFKPTGSGENSEETYQKICIGTISNSTNWQKIRFKISHLTDGLKLPKDIPEVSKNNRMIDVTGANGKKFSVDYNDFEQLLSPTLLISPNIGGAIVPIVKSYASDLFGIETEQPSFLDSPEAVLKKERVYFCSPAAKNVLDPEKIIFFYESGSEKGGKSAIIAVGRITQTNVVLVDDMEKNLLERGVIDQKMLAKASQSGKRTVVFFNNILLLKEAVPFERLDQLGCNDGSKFVTAKSITPLQSQQILLEGFPNA
jgi:GNAT superfamily N-acetyltransferase